MKLNSKLPIIIIGFAITIFLGISINNNNRKPQIETIRGHISDLDKIDIRIKEYESSIYYDFTHTIDSKNEVITTKEKKSDRYFKEQIYTELLDVSCGQDYISYIGYEIDYSKDKNQIYFIVDERKTNDTDKIFDNQGKDEKIINKDPKLRDMNRTKYKLEYPDISPEIEQANILASYRYKGELYVISNYASKYYSESICGKNSLNISKLDKKTKQLKSVNNIDLKEKIKELNFLAGDEIISYDKVISYKDTIYTIVVVNKYDNSNNEGDDIYLLEYNLSSDESILYEININNSLNFADILFENNKLKIILSDTRKDIDLFYTQYDISTKEIEKEFKITLEKRKRNEKDKFIKNAIIKEDNIYITVLDSSIHGLDKIDESIYVIDIDNRCITYEGRVVGYQIENIY